jgi:hypothetical protein
MLLQNQKSRKSLQREEIRDANTYIINGLNISDAHDNLREIKYRPKYMRLRDVPMRRA